MKRAAILILNRNLPEVTDRLVEKFRAQDSGESGIFVIESGSSQDQLSQYATFWADWPEAIKDGLRYTRGFNFGLSQLQRYGHFGDYEFFFLVCNDIEFEDPLVPILLAEMDNHPQVDIMSPCATNWAERELIGEDRTRYVAHGNHLAWMIRRKFVESVMERHQPNHMNFMYDGTNFRGYFADQELIVKACANNFANAITTRCMIEERTELLKTRSDLMRTERYEINLRQMFEEGKEWMRRKYGLNSRRQMTIMTDAFYNQFFVAYPDLCKYRL